MSRVLANQCGDVRVTYPNFRSSGPGVVALSCPLSIGSLQAAAVITLPDHSALSMLPETCQRMPLKHGLAPREEVYFFCLLASFSCEHL